jgi:hypothetical protein
VSFKSHIQEEACGTSNLTLNGIHLPQEWNGDFATGSGLYSGVTDLQQNESSITRELDLEWISACIRGIEETDEAAQVLTVSIKAIDGVALGIPSGFTVSFKQQTSPPSLLRLESVPNLLASHKEVAQSWREPPTHLRLFVTNDTVSLEEVERFDQSLEDNILELKLLQADLQRLQLAIAGKKKHIKSQLREEVRSLTSELNDCRSISCIFKTLVHKARGAWSIAVVGVTPHYQQVEEMSRPEYLDTYAQAHGHVSQLSAGAMKSDSSTGATKSGSSPSRLYETISDELPPRPQQASPFIIALEATLGLLCCGCLIAFIRHKCSSLRTRTERAALREERDTARAYRRAARKHAWRNSWRNSWRNLLGNWRKDDERIADYEEKRTLIQEQESILDGAMQEEIRQLREAHNVVNDLVRDAEEGRAIRHMPCTCQRTPHAAAPYSPAQIASLATAPTRLASHLTTNPKSTCRKS